jgi:hypothetical protein
MTFSLYIQYNKGKRLRRAGITNMSINLQPTDGKTSPLRELDWQDDDYAMEVVSGKLHDRDLDEIFDNMRLLNQRGDTFYSPSMAESGEHCIKVTIPSEYLLLIDQVARKYNDLDVTDALRICLLHGLSIYEHKIGYDIEQLYDASVKDQTSGSDISVAIYNMKTCINIHGSRHSLKIEGRMYRLLNRWSAHAGCTIQNFAGLCILYSFRSHTKIKAWVPKIDKIIDPFEDSLKLRIAILEQNNSKMNT